MGMMVVAVGVSFLAMKLLTLPSRRVVPYLVFWPGMDPRPFEAERRPARANLAPTALLKMALGASLLFVEAPLLIRSWLIILGSLLILHMGAFDLLTHFWRRVGVDVERICPDPWLSKSLSEFWGARWNMAFHAFVRDRIYRPLGRGPAAVAVVFVFSGIMHELVISLPAGGGWGLPTLYFAIHGVLVLLERRGWLRTNRITTLVFVLLPAPLLFHAPFLEAVIFPMVMP
jgi:alginate O-acetyltransferase complex protein AlgI